MRNFKLDGRHNGVSIFKYGVEFKFSELDDFCRVREWCWTNFGPSREYEKWASGVHSKNPRWAWDCNQYKNRIYIGTDTEYSMFLMKFK